MKANDDQLKDIPPGDNSSYPIHNTPPGGKHNSPENRAPCLRQNAISPVSTPYRKGQPFHWDKSPHARSKNESPHKLRSSSYPKPETGNRLATYTLNASPSTVRRNSDSNEQICGENLPYQHGRSSSNVRMPSGGSSEHQLHNTAEPPSCFRTSSYSRLENVSDNESAYDRLDESVSKSMCRQSSRSRSSESPGRLPYQQSPSKMLYQQSGESPSKLPYQKVSKSPRRSPYKQTRESTRRSPYQQSSELPSRSAFQESSESSSKLAYQQSSESPSNLPYQQSSESHTMLPYQHASESPSNLSYQQNSESHSKLPFQQSGESPSKLPSQQASESPTKLPYQQSSESPTKLPYQYTSELPSNLPYKHCSESSRRSPCKQSSESPTKLPYQQSNESPNKLPYQQSSESPRRPPYQSPCTSSTQSHDQSSSDPSGRSRYQTPNESSRSEIQKTCDTQVTSSDQKHIESPTTGSPQKTSSGSPTMPMYLKTEESPIDILQFAPPSEVHMDDLPKLSGDNSTDSKQLNILVSKPSPQNISGGISPCEKAVDKPATGNGLDKIGNYDKLPYTVKDNMASGQYHGDHLPYPKYSGSSSAGVPYLEYEYPGSQSYSDYSHPHIPESKRELPYPIYDNMPIIKPVSLNNSEPSGLPHPQDITSQYPKDINLHGTSYPKDNSLQDTSYSRDIMSHDTPYSRNIDSHDTPYHRDIDSQSKSYPKDISSEYAPCTKGNDTQGRPYPEINDPGAPHPRGNDLEAQYPRGNDSEAPYPRNNDSEAPYPRGNDSEAPYPRGNDSQASYPRGNDSEVQYPKGNDPYALYPRGNDSEAPYAMGNDPEASYPRGNHPPTPYPQGNTHGSPYQSDMNRSESSSSSPNFNIKQSGTVPNKYIKVTPCAGRNDLTPSDTDGDHTVLAGSDSVYSESEHQQQLLLPIDHHQSSGVYLGENTQPCQADCHLCKLGFHGNEQVYPPFDPSADDHMTNDVIGHTPPVMKPHHNYMGLSILVIICFNCPVGLIALLFSMSAESDYETGHTQSGHIKSYVSLMFNMMGIIITVVVMVAVVFYVGALSST